ncbi:MAG: zinc ribbon domain-containing protein [Xanthomonadales bacterium]
MSIISCPQCAKNVSSRAALCPHCGFQLGEASEEDYEIYRARRLRDRIYRLNMISYAVITVFIAGFGWYWWASRGFTQATHAGPYILMGVAALAYLVVRGFLFHARQQRRKQMQRREMSSELRRNL